MIAGKGLLAGKTLGIDATTLEANAALRSIVRRESGESYAEFLTRLAKESGIETPTREELARLDRKRKQKGSNREWVNPHDPEARITKMKDGRTHLAHKAEHAVDLETGAVVAVTVQGADQGDTTTIKETFIEAAEQVEAAGEEPTADEERKARGLEEVVTDKGYHSGALLGRLGGDRGTVLHFRAAARAAEVERQARPAGGGLWESAAHPGRAGQTTPAPAGRVPRTNVCACLTRAE